MLDETFLIVESSGPELCDNYVQMAGFQDRSYVAGPGRRCVLWVSGCRRRCPGCFQPHFFNFNVGNRISVDELADSILCLTGIEGITFSGGEPFEQSAALGSLCRRLKEKSDLSILAYTGYQYEVLEQSQDKYGMLLKWIDILIDGEYREELAGPYLWRGSSNQRIHYFNPEVEQAESKELTEPGIEEIQIAIYDDKMVLTGFPGSDVQEGLRNSLKSRGIVLKPNNG